VNPRAVWLAVLAFLIVAAAGAAFIVGTYAQGLDRSAAEQISEAPDVVALYRSKHATIDEALPDIYQHLARNGLRVTVVNPKTRHAYGPDGAYSRPAFGPGGAPPPVQASGSRGSRGGTTRRFTPPNEFTSIVLAILRMPPHIAVAARTNGADVRIFPDISNVMNVLRNVSIAFGVLFIFAAFGLWWYIRGVKREAMRPLIETTTSLRRLAQRDFTPRTIVTGEKRSAIGDLARAYNEAAEAVSSAFEERRLAEREMQRFIADAGHELRTPLTIVMGYVDVLDGGALADRTVAERVFNNMRTEARRMRRLIDKLIVLARMETPGDGTEPSDIDVVNLAQRVAETLEPLGGGPIVIEGVRHAFVHADEDELDEALSNIVENALKYAPQSPVRVRVDRQEQSVIISISDRGPGMTPEERANAFERFYRGDSRGEVSGSGLGLAIAKRAVERSGGTLGLESIVGNGTTLRITLPASILRNVDVEAGALRP
jgi:signal transduction histidine kinase